MSQSQAAPPWAHAAPPPPPDPPELPPGADPRPRWPAWFAFAGFMAGFAATLMAVIVLTVVLEIAGVETEDESSAFVIGATLLQALILCATAVVFAARTRRPRPWHFGLRATRFWPAVGWTALGLASFYGFAVFYGVLLEALGIDPGEQDVVEQLGADDGTAALIVAGVMVVVVAPIAEEFFFRGFFYRALRTRLRTGWAALVCGGVFGVIHFTGPATLPALPVLVTLGVIFCLVYERTGSLYPCIALHAFNNMIAYGAATGDEGWAVSGALGMATIAGCMLLPRYRPSRRVPLQA